MSLAFKLLGTPSEDGGLEGTQVFGTAITGITAATPCVVTTSAAHTKTNGEAVTILGVTGDLAILNGISFVISSASGSVMTLDGSVGAGLTPATDGTVNQGQNVAIPATAAGDHLIIYTGRNDSVDGYQALEDVDAAWALEPTLSRGNTAGSARSEGLYTKIASGSEPAMIDIRHSDVTIEQTIGVCFSYSGGDAGTLLDVTPVAGDFLETVDAVAARPANPDGTPTTANAMAVICFHMIDNDDVDVVLGVEGYTVRDSLAFQARTYGIADKVIHVAALESPGVWKTIESNAPTDTSDATAIIFFLRPGAVQTDGLDESAFDTAAFDTVDWALIAAAGGAVQTPSGLQELGRGFATSRAARLGGILQ